MITTEIADFSLVENGKISLRLTAEKFKSSTCSIWENSSGAVRKQLLAVERNNV